MSFLPSRPVWAGAVALPPEIAFLLEEGFPPVILARAAGLAHRAGTDAATALLRAGLIGEDGYYGALARRLGLPFLDGPIALGPGIAYPATLRAGYVPLAPGAATAFVLAPEAAAVAGLLREPGTSDWPCALTSPRRLREAVFATVPEAVAAFASDELGIRRPDWAYRPGPRTVHIVLIGLALLAACLSPHWLPHGLAVIVAVAVQSAFLAMAVFRIGALFVPAPTVPEAAVAPLPDSDLPVYTVLVALYREAAVVPRLVRALAALDYPVAKLDIKFLLEADDAETAAAFARASMPARFEVVVVPPGQPRTKPRALNAALPLARGSCLVVYDAEDVPDRDQLRLAAEAFARAPETTACLQGRLVIDNTRDSWLTRCFTLEYSALFDVLGPALAHWHLPTPLGGTSTHFRTSVLRKVHGWDAWNVTEDADLGMRLALAGYDVGDLPSATIEEAPAELGPWLRQRTRWMKGFVQTSFTHGRRPLRTLRQLGPLDGLCAVTMLPGTVVSALVYPLFMGLAVYDFLASDIPSRPAFWPNLPVALSLTLFGTGLVAMLAPAALGCIRRGWFGLLWFVPLLPFYFLLVSLAAWLGVIELIRAPTRWNKTRHGLARHSRSGALRSASPVPRR